MSMRLGSPMPSFEGATEWVNGGPVTPEDLQGRPVLVHFWAVSCHACHDMMPVLRQWREEYAPQGLQVVGVHQPRSEADTEVAAVRRAIEEHQLTHPIAIDNTHAITDRWGNRFVPAFYVFDHLGRLRHYQAGDRGQRMIQYAIERTLASATVP